MTRRRKMCRPETCRPDEWERMHRRQWELTLRRQCEELVRRVRAGSAPFDWEETSRRLQELIVPPPKPTAEELSKLTSLRYTQMKQFYHEYLGLEVEIPAPEVSGREMRRRKREGWELFFRAYNHFAIMNKLKVLYSQELGQDLGWEMNDGFRQRILWSTRAPYWFWYQTHDQHDDGGMLFRELSGTERYPSIEEYYIVYAFQRMIGKGTLLPATKLYTLIRTEDDRGYNRLEADGGIITIDPELIPHR